MRPGEQRRLLHSHLQTGMTGCAGSGNIERCAMVDARPDEGQAYCDVDSLIHAQILDGDQPLIVILGYHNIEAPLPGVHEYSVARPGTTRFNAFPLCL